MAGISHEYPVTDIANPEGSYALWWGSYGQLLDMLWSNSERHAAMLRGDARMIGIGVARARSMQFS